MTKKTIIIAEAGVNHNGDIELAKKLIEVAATAGADYVKFQTFKADKLVSKGAQKAEYQTKNLNNSNESQYDMLKRLELTADQHYLLKSYSESKNVKFLSTGFDEESIDFLDQLGIDVFKIPSGEITNLPYLQHIAKKKKPVILSTGMATLTEVKDAVLALEKMGLSYSDLTILHCNTEYPTPMSDVNLMAMKSMEREFGVKVGYSDHTLGIEIPIAAVALGATLIEKHFTLDRNMPGPDHKASLEPEELGAMIKAIRNTEQALAGTGVKEVSESEKKNRLVGRKSIHLKKKISKGERITPDHLVMKRPASGISPMEFYHVLDKIALMDMNDQEPLTWDKIK